jgi:SAM-dependent methyltransferase
MSSENQSTLELSDLFSGVPFLSRLMLRARYALTPYDSLLAEMPEKGLLVDAGSGFGFLSLHAAMDHQGRQVVGFDHDIGRVVAASVVAREIPNCSYVVSSLAHFKIPRCAAICAIDVLHYLDSSQQEDFLERAFEALEPEGVVLIREVDSSSRVRSALNRFYELVMTRLRFTKALGLCFRPIGEWLGLLSRVGFEVREAGTSPLPLSVDRVLIGRKARRLEIRELASH